MKSQANSTSSNYKPSPGPTHHPKKHPHRSTTSCVAIAKPESKENQHNVNCHDCSLIIQYEPNISKSKSYASRLTVWCHFLKIHNILDYKSKNKPDRGTFTKKAMWVATSLIKDKQ